MKKSGEKHSHIQSTQLLLKERVEQNPNLEDFYFVQAETQSAGRGRSDHAWNSVTGNLHVSILLKNAPLGELTWIPLWVSVSIHQSLVELGVDGQLIQLKWPNDLWVNHSKKAGGILCEKIGQTMIIGIGLNLVEAPHPDAGVIPGAVIEVDTFLKSLILRLRNPLSVSFLRSYYEQFSLFKQHEKIQWQSETSGKQMLGEVVGLGEFGEIVVKTDEALMPLYSETIYRVRPQ